MASIKEKIINALRMYNRATRVKTLQTMEEIEANTESNCLAGAGAVAELNNKLAGCSFAQEGNDFYIVGADAVRKKLGSGDISLLDSTYAGSVNKSIRVTKSGKTLIIASIGGYNTSSSNQYGTVTIKVNNNSKGSFSLTMPATAATVSSGYKIIDVAEGDVINIMGNFSYAFAGSTFYIYSFLIG